MTLKYWAILIVACALGFATTTVVLAQTAVINFVAANTIGFTRNALQIPANLSSVTLVNGGYMNADGLNTDVLTSGESIGYMPGTGHVRILACFNDSAADETTACNNATTNDITLPITGTGVMEFAGDNQFRHIWLNIGTPAVANWQIEWQYYDGTSYIAFDNVGDGTANFTFPGLHRVSWTFPTAEAWPLATLHSIEGYWVRAEVVSLTSLTQAPVGTQVYYETGRWWTLAASLDESEQQEFNIQFGYTENPKDFHYYVPHNDGVVVADDATLEVTGSAVKVFKGYFDVTAPTTGSKSIAFKEDSFEVTIPSDGVIQVQVYPAP